MRSKITYCYIEICFFLLLLLNSYMLVLKSRHIFLAVEFTLRFSITWWEWNITRSHFRWNRKHLKVSEAFRNRFLWCLLFHLRRHYLIGFFVVSSLLTLCHGILSVLIWVPESIMPDRYSLIMLFRDGKCSAIIYSFSIFFAFADIYLLLYGGHNENPWNASYSKLQERMRFCCYTLSPIVFECFSKAV